VDLDRLVCNGNTLRGSIEPTAGGGSAFIAQVTLHSAALGVAISQACYATTSNHERAVLRLTGIQAVMARRQPESTPG
jgi:hypothetical protein